jgi:hypothetical protein
MAFGAILEEDGRDIFAKSDRLCGRFGFHGSARIKGANRDHHERRRRQRRDASSFHN